MSMLSKSIMKYFGNKIKQIDTYLKNNFEENKRKEIIENEIRTQAMIALSKDYEKYQNTPPTVKSISQIVLISVCAVGSIALFTELCMFFDIRF